MYVEVRISRSVSEGLFDFEITRVDYILLNGPIFKVTRHPILMMATPYYFIISTTYFQRSFQSNDKLTVVTQKKFLLTQ